MYPRAADLTSKQVQSYSDRELFWIFENGIRFTGMPAFGKVESSDHIWDIVDYVRTLPEKQKSLLKWQGHNSLTKVIWHTKCFQHRYHAIEDCESPFSTVPNTITCMRCCSGLFRAEGASVRQGGGENKTNVQ
jgi:hypothetical protein